MSTCFELLLADLRQGRRLAEACRAHGLTATEALEWWGLGPAPRWGELVAAAAEGLETLHAHLDHADPSWCTRRPAER